MPGRKKKKTGRSTSAVWRRHSLSLVALGVLALWFVLYIVSDPKSRPGSLFGNAIADWAGVVMTVLVTKWLYEKGSHESRQPGRAHRNQLLEFLHEHSLLIFLVLSGIGWLVLFSFMSPDSRWGTVVSNVVSEWSQQIGLVVLTKKLIEAGSKESE